MSDPGQPAVPSLPSVEEGAVGPSTALPTRVVPVRWIVAGLGTAGVVVLAAVVWLLFGQPQTETVAGAWLPADTVGYAEASAELGPQQRERVLGLLKHFPGFEDQARLGDKLDETLTRVLGPSGIDYRAQVKPWLGDTLAIALRMPADQPSPGVGEDGVPAVVLVDSSDDAAAGTFVGTLADRITDEGGSTTTETYREVTVTTVTASGRSDGTHTGALAVVDGRLVAGESEMVRAVIDVRRGGAESLASSDSFRNAMASLPADRIGALWVDAAGILGAAQRGLGGSGVVPSVLPLPQFSPGSALVGFARAEDDGLLVEVNGRGSISGLALLQPSPTGGAARTSVLVDSAPAQTAVFFEIHDVGAAVGTSLAAARLQDPSGESFRQLDQALAALGTSVDELTAAVGDAALVVTVGGQPRAALVLQMKDPAVATSIISQVDALLGLSGFAQVTTRDYQGTTLHQLELTSGTLPGANAAPVYALVGDALLVGMDEDIVISIIDTRGGGSGLAGEADYQALIGRVGAENSGALYVDLEGLVRAFPLPGMDAEMRAFLEPLRAAGWATRAPGEGQWLGTSRLFLLIR